MDVNKKDKWKTEINPLSNWHFCNVQIIVGIEVVIRSSTLVDRCELQSIRLEKKSPWCR